MCRPPVSIRFVLLLLGSTDAANRGAAVRALTLGDWLAVLRGALDRINHGLLGLALYAVSFNSHVYLNSFSLRGMPPLVLLRQRAACCQTNARYYTCLTRIRKCAGETREKLCSNTLDVLYKLQNESGIFRNLRFVDVLQHVVALAKQRRLAAFHTR